MRVILHEKLCNNCGLCISVCPDQRIVKHYGTVILKEQNCMLCGHCQAVCPLKAIEVNGDVSLFHLQAVEGYEGQIKPGEYDTGKLVQLMRSRRSCRNYQQKEVDFSILEDLVKIGITAPSGTNSQGWNFILLPKRSDVVVLGELTANYYKKLNKMARNPLARAVAKVFFNDSLGAYYRRYYNTVEDALNKWQQDKIDRLFHGATAAIIVTNSDTSSCPSEDALLATQNILLASHAMGLGSCLIGFVVEAMSRDKNIGHVLNVPEKEKVYSVIALGYPAQKFLRPAVRKIIKPRIFTKS